MTKFDARLQRVFSADASPATDPLFRVQVSMRRERVTFRRQLAEAFGFTCVSAIISVFAVQAVDEVVNSSDARLIVTAILATGYVIVFIRRYFGAPSFVHVLRERIKSLIWRY